MDEPLFEPPESWYWHKCECGYTAIASRMARVNELQDEHWTLHRGQVLTLHTVLSIQARRREQIAMEQAIAERIFEGIEHG